MGQQSSTAMPAPATAAAPNVLARDYTGTTVTVHCVEVCNESVHRLQALLASGADAAELDAALPSERFTGAASSTVADVRAFLQAQQKQQVAMVPMSEADRQYYNLPEVDADAATTTTTETAATMAVPLYLYALQGSSSGSAAAEPTLLHEGTELQEVLDRAAGRVPAGPGGAGRCLWLLYSRTEPAQGFDDICCCLALCAGLCACLVSLCCCAAMVGKKKGGSSKPDSSNNHNNNNNNYDNGATYNTGASNPFYSDQQAQYNGQQQGQQQYYGQQGVPNSYGLPPQAPQPQGQAAQPAYYNYAANPL